MTAKIHGDKPFEVRYNDRNFQKGDTVTYITQDSSEVYSGTYEITFVTNYEQKENWVVFADKLINET